jgi:hypothetical protein
MHLLVALTRLFPYWGLVFGLAFVELGLIFMRRQRLVKHLACWGLSAAFFGLIALWFLKRGDLNAEAWVRSWLVG